MRETKLGCSSGAKIRRFSQVATFRKYANFFFQIFFIYVRDNVFFNIYIFH